MEEKQIEFISFCIEMYAKKHNKSGTKTESTKVWWQSPQEIVEDWCRTE